MDQPTSQDNQVKPSQQPVNMSKVGEHALSNGEVALFGEIYASYEKLRQLIAMYLCDKHGYPEKEPVAFEFNWRNRTVTALRPSQIEVVKDIPSDAPPTPAQGQVS